ncbi:hypothetical protein SNE40_004671 [Patella caerulea]|uniref:Uncharacterized protein n=1 Tax=Patella caerulea TaxID=87958 RepID=A0AAN8K9U9_PATCE
MSLMKCSVPLTVQNPCLLWRMKSENPQLPKSSKCMAKNQGKNNVDTEDADASIELERDDEGEDVPGRKKRIRGQPTAVLKWLSNYQEDQKEQFKQREDRAEKQHQDKLERFDKLLSLFGNKDKE